MLSGAWPQTIVGTADGYLLGGTLYASPAPRGAIWSSPDGLTWTLAGPDDAFDIGGYVDTMEMPAAGGVVAIAVAPEDSAGAGSAIAVGEACPGPDEGRAGPKGAWATAFDWTPGDCAARLWRSEDGQTWTMDRFTATEGGSLRREPYWSRTVATTGERDVAGVEPHKVLVSADGQHVGCRPRRTAGTAPGPGRARRPLLRAPARVHGGRVPAQRAGPLVVRRRRLLGSRRLTAAVAGRSPGLHRRGHGSPPATASSSPPATSTHRTASWSPWRWSARRCAGRQRPARTPPLFPTRLRRPSCRCPRRMPLPCLPAALPPARASPTCATPTPTAPRSTSSPRTGPPTRPWRAATGPAGRQTARASRSTAGRVAMKVSRVHLRRGRGCRGRTGHPGTRLETALGTGRGHHRLQPVGRRPGRRVGA